MKKKIIEWAGHAQDVPNQWQFYTCLESVNPDYAARKFGEDAKRRARRRILALQVPDNKTDSVKLRVPCGFKCPRVYHGLNFTFG